MMDESLEREGYEISNSLNKCWDCFAELDQDGRCRACDIVKQESKEDDDL